MEVPDIRYATSGDVRIAYQVTGSGPFDLVFMPGFVSNLDLWWENPIWVRFFSRLAAFRASFCSTSGAPASPTG
jgi:pimeloyl-ACP methyl ester carboxylesterase